jgi:hypothetical protein
MWLVTFLRLCKWIHGINTLGCNFYVCTAARRIIQRQLFEIPSRSTVNHESRSPFPCWCIYCTLQCACSETYRTLSPVLKDLQSRYSSLCRIYLPLPSPHDQETAGALCSIKSMAPWGSSSSSWLPSPPAILSGAGCLPIFLPPLYKAPHRYRRCFMSDVGFGGSRCMLNSIGMLCSTIYVKPKECFMSCSSRMILLIIFTYKKDRDAILEWAKSGTIW